MIYSQLILDIFDLTFDEYEYEDLLKKQIPFLTEGLKDHTGVGAFIYFGNEPGIAEFEIPTKQEPPFDVDGNSISRVDGVELRNDRLNILADTIVHLKNGIIDCLEIWNKNGEDYPTKEPRDYQLEQIWNGKVNRKKIVREG